MRVGEPVRVVLWVLAVGMVHAAIFIPWIGVGVGVAQREPWYALSWAVLALAVLWQARRRFS